MPGITPAILSVQDLVEAIHDEDFRQIARLLQVVKDRSSPPDPELPATDYGPRTSDFWRRPAHGVLRMGSSPPPRPWSESNSLPMKTATAASGTVLISALLRMRSTPFHALAFSPLRAR